jgi:hypothetical protein
MKAGPVTMPWSSPTPSISSNSPPVIFRSRQQAAERQRPPELDPDHVAIFDQTWIRGLVYTETVVEAPAIRLLIREKLKDGRLPYDSMPRFWGGPGDDERCHACDALITKQELVLEGISSTPTDKKPVQFHVVCFHLWDRERREPKS